MDYFQTTPQQQQQQRTSQQQGNNGSGGTGSAQQQYHAYNGLTQQNQTSNLFFQSSQQQQHLQQQTPYFQIQPASAPLDAQQPYHQSSQQQQSHQNSHNNASHNIQHHQQSGIYGSGGAGGGSAASGHQQQQRRSALMNQHHQQQHQQQHHHGQHHQQSAQQTQHQQHHQNQQHGSQQHHQQYQQRSNHNQHHHHQSQQNQHHQHQQSGSGQSHSQQQQHQNTNSFSLTGSMPPPPLSELPVRIAIDSKHVGAVIGQGGNQIRIITKDSHAKVVVETEKGVAPNKNNNHRQDHNSEKVINIIGTNENCTKAVVKILEVVQREINKEDGDLAEIELKIRAHDPLVGRLIGKQGATIKQIMHETGTQILVSKFSNESHRGEGTIPLLERTITVRGQTIECVAQAESKISTKLKKCYEVDLHHRIQAFQNNLQQQARSNPLTSPSSATDAFGSIQRANSAAAAAAGIPPLPFLNNTMKCLRIWVPDNMVGALIGAKGKHIKQIIRDSQANVKIDSPEEKLRRQQEMNGGTSSTVDSNEEVAETSGNLTGEEVGEQQNEKELGKEEKKEEETKKEEENYEHEEDNGETKKNGSDDGEAIEKQQEKDKKIEERMVTITGTDLQLLRAQQMIYEKMSEQMPQQFNELKLRTEISVPSKIVGRIIGRGGQNVRELQRITGATVKIPEEEKNGPLEPVYKEKNEEGTTVVRIIGNVHASHNVQFRLSQLVADHMRNEKKKDGNGIDQNASNTSSTSPPPAHSPTNQPMASPIESPQK